MTVSSSEKQKIIIVKKAEVGKDDLYTKINLDAIEEAMKILKGNCFKLWMYIAKNKDQYQFALSCVDFCRSANVTKPTYLGAVKELVDKGYLVPSKEEPTNLYIFYEGGRVVPSKEDIIIKYDEGANPKGYVF